MVSAGTHRFPPYCRLGACLLAAIATAALQPVLGAPPQTKNAGAGSSDIPKTFTAPLADYDYVKRELMIPMRDGVRLHTVIVIPKGARNAPILLTRTPYKRLQAHHPQR